MASLPLTVNVGARPPVRVVVVMPLMAAAMAGQFLPAAHGAPDSARFSRFELELRG